jgi:hypothetical protein
MPSCSAIATNFVGSTTGQPAGHRGAERDTDAGTDRQLVAVNLEPLGHRTKDAVGSANGLVDIADIRQQHGELVSAKPLVRF